MQNHPVGGGVVSGRLPLTRFLGFWTYPTTFYVQETVTEEKVNETKTTFIQIHV